MSKDARIITIIGLLSLILIIGGVFFLNKPGKNPASTAIDTSRLVRSDSQKIASDAAKVTIVEFADFECPACGVAHPTTQKILADYKGRINYVFRHFPLPQHKNGMKAALAAEAAGEQGKFWEMYNLLFEKQEEWSKETDPRTKFLEYAKSFGSDTNKFQEAVNSNKFADKIQNDKEDGLALGINSTPTFFINQQKLTGAPSYEEFKAAIDSELSK